MMRLFKILEDGAWHNLNEIAEQIHVPVKKLTSHCETISKHGVIEYDANSNRVRLEPELMNMITRLKADEEAETKWEKMAVGTVIIPPQKGFHIQGVFIHNMTNQDLEFELRFNKKLKEIVISKV